MTPQLTETSSHAPAGVVGATARIRAIDLLKLLALAGVVACHSAMETDALCGWAFLWWVRIFEMAVVIAIPGFFFASGYVLLGRRENCGYRYVARKCLALIVASFVMGFLIIGWRFFSTDAPWFHAADFANEILCSMFKYGLLYVLWFVGALMMVYLLYPLINRLYLYNKRLFGALLLTCLVLMAFFSSAYLLGNREALWYEPDIPQHYRLWIWVGYFCLGGMMKACPSILCVGKWWVILSAAAATLLVNHIGYGQTGVRYFEYVYGSPAAVLLVTSVAAFLLRADLSGGKFRFLDSVGGLFFPAFLLCECALEIVAGYTARLHPAIFLPVNIVAALTLGIAGAWVLTHIRGFSRLLRL